MVELFSQCMSDPLRDSSRWNAVKARSDDIIIATCYKAGTTLVQQIVHVLLNGDKEFDAMRSVSPWIESRLHGPSPSVVEALPSPRFLKTHLHPKALPWHTHWKYIYIGRDGRDVGLSLYNHIRVMAEEALAMGEQATHHAIPVEFAVFWDQWVETGKPRWDFWENVAGWWQVRHHPNVLLLHYADLVNHKPQTVERIAHFLGCQWNEEICQQVCEQSSLDYMRQLELAGKLGSPDKHKKKTGLVNRGGNGRWKDRLTQRQLARYQDIVAQRLEPECAEWLHKGPVMR